jgi:hypothetical protein
MKQSVKKDPFRLITKEIQAIISISYIIIVGIGMLFNYQKYSEFDINIFDYSDIFDFLIAPLSDFYIILFATISILFVSIFIKLDSMWKNKWPKSYSKLNFGRDKKPWYKVYQATLFTISFALYLHLAADYYGRYVKAKIINESDISIVFTDNKIKSGKLIGKTKDMIFLLNGENVFALPINSWVKEIKIK